MRPLPAQERSFEDVAGRVAPRLYRSAVALCRDPDAAQDVVQDTLLQAFRKWHQFEGRSDPVTWLYTIAARVCRRRHRRRAGEPAVMEPLDELLPPPTGPIVDVSRLGDPETHFAAASVQEAVTRAIADLPLAFRMPLVLVDIAEMSTSEAARILAIKEATVKTRVHRARLKLRKALSEGLPQRQHSTCDHERRICLDLLEAKQDALDRKVPFSMSEHALCARCGSVYATLDLALTACRKLGADDGPEGGAAGLAVRAALTAARDAGRPPGRRGGRPGAPGLP